MRIMVVAPGPRFSTYDTFTYYLDAFKQLGHKVSAFRYHDHYAYHATALAYIQNIDSEDDELRQKAIQIAAEDLISRIARTRPELIFIVSGIALPPGVWDWLDEFKKALIKPFTTMILFTESPYLDETQKGLLARTDLAATMDKSSLGAFKGVNANTIYVPHAHNPSVHKLMPFSPERMADVFMVGTGFPERIKLLAGIDWSGIDLRIFGGNWGDTEDSKALEKFYSLEFLENSNEVSSYYTNSKISLNIFRTARWPGENVLHINPGSAYSVSPRCFEIMGCGGFLLTDARPELLELFESGKDMVIFDGADDLSDKIRYYLVHDDERQAIAMSGLQSVARHTYENRATDILKFVNNYWRI